MLCASGLSRGQNHRYQVHDQDNDHLPKSQSILSFINNEEKLTSELSATAVIPMDFKNNTQQ
jgi:hypothetical protein